MPHTALGWTSDGMSKSFEASLDVVERRLDQDRLPAKPGEPSASGKELLQVSDRARDEVRQVLALQRAKTLHARHAVVARLQSDAPLHGAALDAFKKVLLHRSFSGVP